MIALSAMTDEEPPSHEQVSELLAASANRDPAARDALMPVVYGELRRPAHHFSSGGTGDLAPAKW